MKVSKEPPNCSLLVITWQCFLSLTLSVGRNKSLGVPKTENSFIVISPAILSHKIAQCKTIIQRCKICQSILIRPNNN